MVATSKHIGLVAHLRRWGLNVEEIEGWRHKGRPYNFYPRAIMPHHTASSSESGNFGSEGTVVNGRPGLPGPLCQFLLGRDGTVRLVAAGYANHAGYGGPRAGIPENMGNTYSYGIEAENNGLGEPWSKKQLNAYYRLCAALLAWMKIKDVSKVFGHKEWAPGRKIDPAGIDMNVFRANVQRALDQGPSVKTVNLSRLLPGKRNEQVVWVKRRLKRKGFFDGPVNKYFGKGLQKAYAEYQRSLGYTGASADGIPGRDSLRKLGFRVWK